MNKGSSNLKIAAALCGALLSSNAFAWHGTVTGKINVVEFHTNDSSHADVRVRIIGHTELCSKATANDNGYLRKLDTPEEFEMLVSTLLSAKMADRKVTLYMNQGTHGCAIGRVDVL